MRYLVLSILLLLIFPAQAQEKPEGGLSYTTMGAHKTETTGHMNYKVLKYEEDDKFRPLDSEDEKEEPTEDEEAASKIWAKYKALAAGQYKEPEKEDKSVSPEHIAVDQDEESAPVGIAGIIEEYRKNKSQRTQMRTIHVSPPEEEKKEEKKAEKENGDESKEKPGG